MNLFTRLQTNIQIDSLLSIGYWTALMNFPQVTWTLLKQLMKYWHRQLDQPQL